MHEVSLCEGIVAAVRQRAAGRPVARVRIRAGVMLRVGTPSMQQAFALLTAGTEAERAVVELLQVPAQLTCHGCGQQGETSVPLAVCPVCGGSDVQVAGGDELVLESITLRDPVADTAAAGPG